MPKSLDRLRRDDLKFRRNFLGDVPVEPSVAALSMACKLDVLLRVTEASVVPRAPHFAEVGAAALAACSALCAFDSPRRCEVLAAVRNLCTSEKSLSDALTQPGVLRRAEGMLPGASATMMLTITQAHLVPFEAKMGQLATDRLQLIAAGCAVLGGSGPQLGPLRACVWQAVYLLLPAAAAHTVALADSSPHALHRKCLLAALLKMTSGLSSVRWVKSQAEYGAAEIALVGVLRPCLLLTRHLEQLLQDQPQQQQLQQQQDVDLATALANCLSVYCYTIVIVQGPRRLAGTFI